MSGAHLPRNPNHSKLLVWNPLQFQSKSYVSPLDWSHVLHVINSISFFREQMDVVTCKTCEQSNGGLQWEWLKIWAEANTRGSKTCEQFGFWTGERRLSLMGYCSLLEGQITKRCQSFEKGIYWYLGCRLMLHHNRIKSLILDQADFYQGNQPKGTFLDK